jgi:hypothetical protein
MRTCTNLFGRVTRKLIPLALLLSLGALPTAHTVLASTAHRAPAGLDTVLLKIQPTVPGLKFSQFNPNNPNFSLIRAGHNPRIVLYAHFSNVTAPLTVHVHLTGTQGNKLVYDSVGTFTVGRAQLGGASSGWRWYWNDIGGLTKKPGQTIFVGVISAGGVQQQRAIMLRIVP